MDDKYPLDTAKAQSMEELHILSTYSERKSLPKFLIIVAGLFAGLSPFVFPSFFYWGTSIVCLFLLPITYLRFVLTKDILLKKYNWLRATHTTRWKSNPTTGGIIE